jgi:HEAT repeat protein
MALDPKELVAAALTRPGDLPALAALRAAGRPALRAVLAAVDGPDPNAPDVLGPVVGDLIGPEDVPMLTALARADAIVPAQFAIAALGASRCPEALAPLTDLVLERGPLVMRRRLAAAALAELADARACAPLRDVIHELAPDADGARALAGAAGSGALDQLRLLLDAVQALFQLGDPGPSAIAVAIAAAPVVGSHAGERWSLRTLAARTLWFVAAPGMVAALRACLATAEPELRDNALFGLFHLGAAAVVDDLLRAASDPDDRLARVAASYLAAMLGDARPDSLDPAICYRRGAPLDVGALIDELTDRRRDALTLLDLRILTGVDLVATPRETARFWWRSSPRSGARGVLLKWGYPQDLTRLI